MRHSHKPFDDIHDLILRCRNGSFLEIQLHHVRHLYESHYNLPAIDVDPKNSPNCVNVKPIGTTEQKENGPHVGLTRAV